jgi:hypothetical protein
MCLESNLPENLLLAEQHFASGIVQRHLQAGFFLHSML